MTEAITTEQEELIKELTSNPVKFTQEGGIQKLIDEKIEFNHLRGIVCRIYDVNETQLQELSNANTGKLGEMNRKATDERMTLFNKKVDSQKNGKKYYRIYAEGDSWFQFPKYIHDIIDHLNDKDDFLIVADAYGGDWITNIIYEEQYIAGLSTYMPEIFLISGGGNDLVGSHRLAVMVDKKSNLDGSAEQLKKYTNIDQINSNILSTPEKQMIMEAQKYLNKEFYALLAVFELQYTKMFNNLYNEESKHKNIISITQGYDYPIPSPKRRFSFSSPLQPLINKFLDSGNWLYTPLMAKGILDEYAQRSIMFALIYEFNEMLSSFAKNSEYKVFHVDSRGLTKNIDDWYDELHLKEPFFGKVAKAYEYIIRNHQSLNTNRIIRTKDL
jgi:hypothetical protein